MGDSKKTEQTRQVMRAIHEGAASGDTEKERQLLSPNFVIEEPPYLPYGGIFRGHDGFLQLAARAAEFVDFSTVAVESLTVEDELAFVVLRARLWSGAEILATEQWRVENGLAVHCRISWFDASPASGMVQRSPAGAAQ